MDLRIVRLDSEFDDHLTEIKPFLLNLPLKSGNNILVDFKTVLLSVLP